jgi:hypothetical protein
VEYQFWCEDKFLLYPESVPIRIIKKWEKWLPEFGIIAQLIDGSLQLKIEERREPWFSGRRSMSIQTLTVMDRE